MATSVDLSTAYRCGDTDIPYRLTVDLFETSDCKTIGAARFIRTSRLQNSWFVFRLYREKKNVANPGGVIEHHDLKHRHQKTLLYSSYSSVFEIGNLRETRFSASPCLLFMLILRKPISVRAQPLLSSTSPLLYGTFHEIRRSHVYVLQATTISNIRRSVLQAPR